LALTYTTFNSILIINILVALFVFAFLECVEARLLALVFCLGSKGLAFSATLLPLFHHFSLCFLGKILLAFLTDVAVLLPSVIKTWCQELEKQNPGMS